MAEAITNARGKPNFIAYSAGSHPTGMVRPEALKQIEMADWPTTGLRSKSWEEFAKPDAPKLDFVFTVCDSAAKEVCPVWPGQPLTAALGCSRSRGRSGNRERSAACLQQRLLHASAQNRPVPESPAEEHRQAGAPERNRQYRPAMKFNLRARVVAEFLGTGFLVAAVVGSGIMAERLSAGNTAIALLANTIATGAALAALMLTVAPISGAHMNPRGFNSKCARTRAALVGNLPICLCAINWGDSGNHPGARNVCASSDFSFPSRSQWFRAIPE